MKMESIGFALFTIKTEQFAILEENYSPKKKEIDFFTDLEVKISEESKQIIIYAGFTFKQAKKSFIKIQVSCHFEIKEDAWDSYVKEKKIIFPKAFIAHLVMISVGTARGILHAKTEGTRFNEFILPTINVNELVNKDAEFDLM